VNVSSLQGSSVGCSIKLSSMQRSSRVQHNQIGRSVAQKVQSSTPRCNDDQGTSTVISKSRNAGIPGKMIVRHRHFYGPALSSYVNLKCFFVFLLHISTFQHFFEKFDTFWSNIDNRQF
jgi:hypothetical protein